MTTDAFAPPPSTPSWLKQLRRSSLVVLVAGISLGTLVLMHDLKLSSAVLVFVCIAGVSMVPLQLSEGVRARENSDGERLAEGVAVRAVIGAMPEPTVLLDRVGRVLHLNAPAAQLAPALRRNELALFALRSPEIITVLREAIATMQPQRATYVERVPVERWMELVVTPLAVPTEFGGADNCFLMTFRDQTPLRRAEEMRADFVANASHELRTPLAALSGFIDTLQGPARDDTKARERFLGIMHAQATRMARLIDDLLSLSRVELSAHVRPEARVDLLAILRQVIDGLEVLANERGVVIETQFPKEPVFIAGDTEELLRVFENLIENGLKYGASGGRVTVSLTRTAPEEGLAEIRVAVRDYGPGIAPEHLPRLTERFYRTDVGDSRAQGGTGLGLSLVKHIVSRHGGRLLIESVFGKGATFSVCFPPLLPPLGS
jgi:two-component system phosphate regulon sensor histidine kinase PhoR